MTAHLRWTVEQLDAYKKRVLGQSSVIAWDRALRPSPGEGRSKYGNERTNGYASKREAARAQMLQLMEKAGEIAELREQVEYELIPAQYDADDRLVERPCHYVCDFQYRIVATGMVVVEDAKGVATDVYRIKKKLMYWRHGIRVQEV